jgi:small subunit ribosomal protein S2
MKNIFFKKYVKSKKNKNFFYNPDFFYNNKFYIGQLIKRWHYYMRFYILYKEKNFHIFNMIKTLNNIKRSIFFLINIVCNRGKVFLIDNNIKYKNILYLFQKLTKQKLFEIKWIGGLITNFKEFFFVQNKEKKNELLEGFWLYKKLGNYKDLTRLPDVALFFNGYYNSISLNEFQLMGIPLIAVINSDLNPSNINFVLASRDEDFIIYLFYILLFVETIIMAYLIERNFYFRVIKNFYYLRFVLNLKRKIKK